ncbi:TonB family protein [Luteolibacter sp.]
MTLINPGLGEKGDIGESSGGSDFEMNLSSRNSAESPPESPEPPAVAFTASVRKPVTVFPELASTIELPPIAPMQLISSVPASRPTSATTGTSQATSSASANGKSSSKGAGESGSGKSGAGHGSGGKRAKSVSPPKLLQAPPPRYPAKTKAAKITGRAAVLIQVRGDGSAGSTSLYRSSGNGELDQAAVVAARLWKFSPTPTLGGGETIAVVVHVTFSL